MKCELCGGLVTWRGPLSALTHTECESCGGQNCQVVDLPPNEDEPCPATFVGHSVLKRGWCVYTTHSASEEYETIRGPFATRTEADASLARLMARSKTPNVESSGPL